ncbi:Pam16-domain-containing protein, partial [Amanita rubescens]
FKFLATGTKILGKAFYEAGKQAAKNAKHRPAGAAGSDISGVENAKTGSITDTLTREHRMTLDEAQLILNVKRSDGLEQMLKHYEHMFKANSPPIPEKSPPSRSTSTPAYSHYLQSKVVRAKERIEAEMKILDSPSTETGANRQ